MSKVIVVKDISGVSYISEVEDDFKDPKPGEFTILEDAYQLFAEIVPVKHGPDGKPVQFSMLINLIPIDPSVVGPQKISVMPSSFYCRAPRAVCAES